MSILLTISNGVGYSDSVEFRAGRIMILICFAKLCLNFPYPLDRQFLENQTAHSGLDILDQTVFHTLRSCRVGGDFLLASVGQMDSYPLRAFAPRAF